MESAESHASDLCGPIVIPRPLYYAKLILNAGDEFFVPTSSQFYYDKLPDEKYLRYVPNVGRIDDSVLETVLAFYANSKSSHIAKYRLGNVDDGAIEVTTMCLQRRERLERLEQVYEDFRLPVIARVGCKASFKIMRHVL